MFIPRSSARLRLVRLLFLGLALGPSALVATWAAHLRSDGHRDDVRRGWERALGVPIRVGAVTHPRPGVVWVESCVMSAPDGPARLALPRVEVETSAAEVRLRIPSVRGDAAAAGLLAALAADWLARGARFDRNCVIEVDDFVWVTPGVEASNAGQRAGTPSGLRIECVATAEGRAVRVVRRGAEGQSDSEVRVVRSPGDEPAGDAAGPAATARIDVVGRWTDPLPWGVLVALASATPTRESFTGPGAAVTGRVEAWRDDRGWHGSLAGRIEDVDLAACGATLGVSAAGSAMVDVRTIEWAADRIVDCELEWRVGRGHVSSSFIEALIGTLGCRLAMPLAGAAVGGVHSFEAAGALVRIHAGGLELLAGPRLSGALALADGKALIWPPSGPVPLDRLAWLLAPPRTPAMPAAGPGAWLMAIMPKTGAPDGAADDRGDRPPRREF
jgi:hypothetical protein